MPVLGLVGGMSWHASALYYRRINKEAERRYGSGATVETVLFTLRFADLLAAGQAGNWDEVNRQIVTAARRCADAGADLVMITAFTGHSAAKALEEQLPLPLVHAGDAFADAVSADQTVGLLGTQFMLDAGVIKARLQERGLRVVQADAPPANRLDDAILGDLTQGNMSPSARGALEDAINDVVDHGADKVLLACTELPLLIANGPADDLLVDGVTAHINAALNRMETLQ
ncbi:MAG: amino acid racemase [Pseudomonadota bacterium]